MARRSGGGPSRGSAMGRGRSPSPMAARRPAPPPAQPAKSVAPQPPTQPMAAQPSMAAPGGGMMANIATTAAGVAIGHTMGHALTGALGMGGHGSSEPAQVESVQQQQPQQQMASNQEPCKFELEQFLSCAQSQSNDLSLCDGFNAVLRECKVKYGGNQMHY